MIKLPEKKYVASIDVDPQKTFTEQCPNEVPVPNAEHIVDELNRQANYAQYRVGTKDAHSPQAIWIADKHNPVLSEIEGDNVDVRWPAHAVPGTPGFELIEGLPKVTDYDFFVWKGVELDMHPYGNCYHDLAEKMSTGLIEYLKHNNVTTVLVGGLIIEYCVKNTALQLKRADLQVIVNLAACQFLDPEISQQACLEMKEQGINIIESHKDIQQ